MSFRDTMLQRYPTGERFQTARSSLERLFDDDQELRTEHQKIASNSKLSAEGKVDAVRNHISTKTALGLYAGQRTVETMRAKVTTLRTSLQPKAPDPTNFAQAIVREGVRAHLRSLSPNERAALVLQSDADPRLLSAVLESPSFVSGLTDDVIRQVTRAAIERDSPGAFARVEAMESAADILQGVVGYVNRATSEIGRFANDHHFADFVRQSVAPKATAIDAQVDQHLAAFGDAA